ncbi:MAG: AMP-binding protein [Desulfovibrio sp.]|nr:AMP-binding protein [Desulfovibrio sp.]
MSFAKPSKKEKTLFACDLDQWLAKEAHAKSAKDLPQAIERAQFQALAEVLERAVQNNAFYAQRLRQCNLSPRNRQDMAQLPFLTAEDLNPYTRLLTTSQDLVERLVTVSTSGTTASPKRIGLTRNDLNRTRDFFAVGLRYLVKAGQSVAVLLPGGNRPNGVVDLIRQALLPRGCQVLSVNTQDEAWPEALRAISPQVLIAMPSQLHWLKCQRVSLPGLTGILASAEPLDCELARQYGEYWHCEVLNHYGLTEVGYGCAVECPAHGGMHLRALDVLVEIIDPRTQEVLPVGCVGEIVVTTLKHQAMPLIRYRTGDISSLIAAPCPCGSPLMRLGPVLGRLEAGRVVQLPKGGRFCLQP